MVLRCGERCKLSRKRDEIGKRLSHCHFKPATRNPPRRPDKPNPPLLTHPMNHGIPSRHRQKQTPRHAWTHFNMFDQRITLQTNRRNKKTRCTSPRACLRHDKHTTKTKLSNTHITGVAYNHAFGSAPTPRRAWPRSNKLDQCLGLQTNCKTKKIPHHVHCHAHVCVIICHRILDIDAPYSATASWTCQPSDNAQIRRASQYQRPQRCDHSAVINNIAAQNG